MLSATPLVARAQTENTRSKTAAAAVEEIVVTGSRIVRRDYASNSPIVTVGKDEIEKLGSVTVDTLLNQMPQFVPSVSSTSNNPSNGGQANIDLRGMGTARTMVLLDGHRVVPSNANGTVDINIIPSALIQNIEVITGGAPGDLRLRRDGRRGELQAEHQLHRPLQMDAQYGVTEEGDGREGLVAHGGRPLRGRSRPRGPVPSAIPSGARCSTPPATSRRSRARRRRRLTAATTRREPTCPARPPSTPSSPSTAIRPAR
ncbi:TonB-dependent receptor plug domain-containing protein [Caulobacter segnis]